MTQRIVRDDWSIDVRFMGYRDRPEIDRLNRRQSLKSERAVWRRLLRRLLARYERPVLVPAPARIRSRDWR